MMSVRSEALRHVALVTPRSAPCSLPSGGCWVCALQAAPCSVWLRAHVVPTECSRALWPPPHNLTYACTGLSCLQI